MSSNKLTDLSCEICDKSFPSSKAVKRHIHTVHPDEYESMRSKIPSKKLVVKGWSEDEISKLAYYEAYLANKATKKLVSGADLSAFLQRPRSSINLIRRKASYKTKLNELLELSLEEIKSKIDFHQSLANVKCDMCGKLFMTDAGVIRHKVKKHNYKLTKKTEKFDDRFTESEMRAIAKVDAENRELNNNRLSTEKVHEITGIKRRPRAIDIIRNNPTYMNILQEEIDKLEVPQYDTNPALKLCETEFNRRYATKCIDCGHVFRNRRCYEIHYRFKHDNQMTLTTIGDYEFSDIEGNENLEKEEKVVKRKKRRSKIIEEGTIKEFSDIEGNENLEKEEKVVKRKKRRSKIIEEGTIKKSPTKVFNDSSNYGLIKVEQSICMQNDNASLKKKIKLEKRLSKISVNE